MLEIGDKSCMGVAIYCGSDGTSDMVNPRLHLRLAQDRCELLHKRNLFAGERFDLDTLNHETSTIVSPVSVGTARIVRRPFN
jgi:hypothetical protein